MNRTIIAVILGAIILVLIGFLFVGDAQDTTVLKVGDVSYDLDDFESYVRVWNYEDDTSTDLDKMFTNYQSYKIYSTRAEKANVELEEDEYPAELESGDAEKLLNDYGLTSGEYMRVKTEIAKANKLYSSPYELGKISSSYFDDYKTSFVQANGKDVFDTFDYRIIEIPFPQDVEVEDENAEVIDESGDEEALEPVEKSGEDSGEEARKEQERKDEAKSKADKVRDIVVRYVKDTSGDVGAYIEELSAIVKDESADEVSGDIFEYIGANESKMRYIQNTQGFSTVSNGELTSASRLYFAEDMTGSSSYLPMFGYGDDAKLIVSNVQSLSKGEVSEVFETSEGYAFAYLEDVRNELDESDETRFLNEVANAYIGQNAKMTFNKIKVSKLSIEDIIPKLARDAASGEQLEETAEVIASEDEVPDLQKVVDEPELEITSGDVETEEVVE